MASRSFVPFLLALISAGVVAGTATASANTVPYKIQIDSPTKTIAPNGSTTFEITITNQSENDIDLYVERNDATFPDSEWTSSFCFNGNCFDPSVTAPPPATLHPGASTLLELTISGSATLNSSGKVKVRFSNFLGSNSTIEEFSATVSAGASVPTSTWATAIAVAYPNPASTSTQVSIPASITSVQGVSATLYNTRGEIVADLSDNVRTAVEAGSDHFQIDLAGLQSGKYFYTIAAAGKAATGSVVVVR